jgi:hypothetical protein
MGAKTEWIVTGGEGKGGIAVSLGKAPGSAQLPERLATGSLVQQKDLQGKLLRYVLLAGIGPKRGWVSVDGLTSLAERGGGWFAKQGAGATAKSQEKSQEKQVDMWKQLQEQNVQVFNMTSSSMIDKDFADIVSAKEKAERERLAIEFEAMCWEDEEAEQMRTWHQNQEKQALAQRRAAQEQAERVRRIEEEQAEAQRNAEALAAADEARRASGDVQVCVYVNRSLKIKVEFWMTPGSPGEEVHATFAGEVSQKFANMRFDPAAVALRYCEDGAALGHSLRGGDEDSRVELEINR